MSGVEPPPPGLGARAAGGAAVIMVGQLAKITVQFCGIVLLARLLTPYDYGLMAMVTAIVGMAEILRDFGLSSAAIQARHLSREQRDNLFWINSGIGLVLAIVVFLSASWIARFYHEPGLLGITQALAVTFLFNGMTTQYRAYLSRALRFGQVSLSDVGAQVLGLVAGVGMALAGYGYWALVGQQVTQALVNLLLAGACARWLPGSYRQDVPMRGFLSFGWNLMAAQLLGYASRNLGQVIIGQRIGPEALGLYNRAFQLLMMPLNQINAPATSVALPVLSQLQDDPLRFGNFLLRGQAVMVHLIVGLFAFSCAQALPLMVLALGEQWRSAVPLFQVLTLGGIFQTASYATYWAFLALGLMRQQLVYSVVGRLMLIACIFAGSRWGVMGVTVGYTLGLLAMWPLSVAWIARTAPQIPAWALFTNALRAVLGYGFCGGVSYLAAQQWGGASLWLQALVGAVAMAMSVLSVFALWPAFRRDVLAILQMRKLLGQARSTG